MASVSKETRSGRTLYRIQFRDANKRRKSIRLGGLAKKDAHAICSKVGALVSASISKRPLDNAAAQWLIEIGDDLHEKLANAGLCEPRESAQLGQFISDYIKRRSNVAERTRDNWTATKNKLTEFFGVERSLRGISPGDAEDWREWIANSGKAEATVGGHVKRAKQFFRYAVKKRLCEPSPFVEVKGGRQYNRDRLVFVPCETVEKLIKAAPNAQWRAIIALARYGGLRTPSETLELRWQDIDWDAKRFIVHSPKTRRLGKPKRVVPLFPRLEEILSEAFALAGEGSVYVVERYRSQDVNLRTQFERIADKASITLWEKPFQNLRASRETELANVYPLHVVTGWLGNSPKVASQHYLQVTDQHFAQATTKAAQDAPEGGTGGGAVSDEKVVQGVVTQLSATTGNESILPFNSSGETVDNAGNPTLPTFCQYAQEDSNLRPTD